MLGETCGEKGAFILQADWLLEAIISRMMTVDALVQLEAPPGRQVNTP